MDDTFCSNKEIDYDYEKHWNNAYLKTPVSNLGWYEEDPIPSMNLIKKCKLPKNALIFNAGAGATTLIEHLLNEGYSNIVVNDIAVAALTELKTNLSDHKNSQLKFIVDDLINPTELLHLKNVDLWHDRAVLHFFTTEEQQEAYFELLRSAVRINGFVILAEFELGEATLCSGLTTFNYNEKMLQERLGTDFELLKSFNYRYRQPAGNTKRYIYTLFQRKVKC